MASNRLEILKNMVSQNPGDSRTRYMLAMELANTGDLEAAFQEYAALIAGDPGYAYAYYHGGQALEKLGRVVEAREMYLRGVEAADRTGDAHARDELQRALGQLS